MEKKVYVITSWDDTDNLDLRMMKLLDKYDLKGTFFVITDYIDKKITLNSIKDISINHEIGAHTVNHVTLTDVEDRVAYTEMFQSKKILEKHLDKKINSFAYPKGKYNKTHIKLAEEIGYESARTTKSFYINKPKNRYEMHSTLWTYPHAFKDVLSQIRLYKISINFMFNPFIIKQWDLLGKKIFDLMENKSGVYHIFGHSWQIEEKKSWDKLENLFDYISSSNKIECLTIEDYIKKIKSDNIV